MAPVTAGMVIPVIAVVVILKCVPYALAGTVYTPDDRDAVMTLEYNGRRPLRMVTPPFTSRAVAGVVVWIPNAVPSKNKLVFPNNPVPPVATDTTLPNPVEPTMDTDPPPPPAPAGPCGPVGPVTIESAPVGPVNPVAPAPPVTPVGPVAPVNPVKPVLPVNPVKPVGP